MRLEIRGNMQNIEDDTYWMIDSFDPQIYLRQAYTELEMDREYRPAQE